MSRESPYRTSQASLPPRSSPDGVRVSYPLNAPISYPQIQDSPQTVHRPDLFFVNNPRLQNAHRSRAISQPSSSQTLSSFPIHQLYPAHQQAFYQYTSIVPTAPPPRDIYANYPPPPPPPRPAPAPQYNASSTTNLQGPPPPILSPKPIVYPDIGAGIPRVHSYPSMPSLSIPQASAPPPLPPPKEEEEEQITSPDTEDANELAMALALSQSESIALQKIEEDLRSQEEEDLARALAESLLSTGSAIDPNKEPFFSRVECSVSSTSVVNTPRRVESPTPVQVDVQPAGAASTSGFTEHNYPEFGLHEKWHIPGFQGDASALAAHFGDGRAEEPIHQISSHESTYISPGALAVPERPPRPPSIASVSSLAYMRDPLDDRSLNGTSMAGRDNDAGLPDSSASPDASPEIASTDSHSSPSWISAQMVDVYSDETNILAFDDEAYARQLAAEEEALAAREQYPDEKAQPLPLYTKERQSSLPVYTPSDEHTHFVTSPISDERLFMPLASTSSASPSYSAPIGATPSREYPSPHVQYTQPASTRAPSGSDLGSDFRLSYSSNLPSIHRHSNVTYPSLENNHEPEHDTRSDSSHNSLSRASITSSIPRNRSYTASSASSHTELRPSGAAPPVGPAGVLNPNRFIDRQLLVGVSIGFKTPTISAIPVPMQDPMPNIISLPYARCPPLHLQAPDWLHLLRLMAHLRGTRIEPTVEAMAVSKSELKLRTVVQFIKPRPTSTEWRTILWFTIDHPVPSSLPGAARYTTPNPNLLPWSYTLSPIPMLLRDATDTNISKTFTIPPSESVPLPTLPIAFPDLAAYLQAALDESRMHFKDSPTGLGKLGKVMQICYPAQVGQAFNEFDVPGRTGVSGMFKRVMKRANKDKKKGKATNNEETYQLVTPFVPDEWG